jgi:Family of unknown function (DUF6370)
MKKLSIYSASLGLMLLTGCALTGPRKAVAGCATCIFHMKDVTGCKLAVKIDGKPYLVAGSDIDDHGNAHAADGLCNAARDAIVEGKVQDGQFVAKKIEVLAK